MKARPAPGKAGTPAHHTAPGSSPGPHLSGGGGSRRSLRELLPNPTAFDNECADPSKNDGPAHSLAVAAGFEPAEGCPSRAFEFCSFAYKGDHGSHLRLRSEADAPSWRPVDAGERDPN